MEPYREGRNAGYGNAASAIAAVRSPDDIRMVLPHEGRMARKLVDASRARSRSARLNACDNT